MLRLFGDCWAVAILSLAVWLWMKGWWKSGTVCFRSAFPSPPHALLRLTPKRRSQSRAGVKMNILLYMPGLLVIYWKALGPAKMLVHLGLILLVQVRPLDLHGTECRG